MPHASGGQPVHDPKVLRAIAHPVRNRILAELTASGPMRAADIARELGVPANQASFHLRQLAKYGLVEEAPEEGRDRRDRVWRLADPDGITFRTEEIVSQPGGEAAFEVFRRNGVAWGYHLVDRAYARDADRRREKNVSEWALRLTPEEADRRAADLAEVAERWHAATSGDDDQDRVTYSIFQLIQPYPELPEGRD